MKNIILLVLVFFAITNPITANNWLNNFEDAQKEALTSNKLILVDFWANWCGPCKRMDSESWSNDEVKILMQNYVPVKIDIDIYKQFASKYNVNGIPYIFIMDGNGKVLYQQMSYKTKSQVLSLLNKYAINTEFLKQHLINFYAHPSFSSAFRLASKYNDFSITVNEDVKYDILKVSDDYFDISEKLLKKSDLNNKNVFLQKIDLFKIQGALVLNNSDKASKLLSKINESDIDASNLGFFNFLNYIVYKEKNDEKLAAIWMAKLSENDIEKAEVFLKSI